MSNAINTKGPRVGSLLINFIYLRLLYDNLSGDRAATIADREQIDTR